MNKLITILLFGLTLNLNAQSDYFEGKISFNLQYYDSLGKSLDPATIGRDTSMHYYVSDGNYKSLNERGEITQLFNSSTNKYYFNNQGQIQVMDATFKFPQNGVVKPQEGELEVLGRKCKKLIIESDNDLTTYYYSEDVTVNKDYYQNHNFGNWNLFLNSSNGAIALKYEIIYPAMGLSIIMEADEIEELDLTEGDFDINSYLEK